MFKKHCQNLREINKAIDIVESDIKKAIRYKRTDQERLYTKLLCALIVSWLDIRILKLVNEVSDYKNPNSHKIFKDDEIRIILNASSLLDKWKIALNLSAHKAYKLKLTKNNLKIKSFENQKTFELRYNELIKIIDNEIDPTINIRNKVDHGQLKYAYTNIPLSFSHENTKELNKINIILMRSKMMIFKNIANIIHDLTVSKKTFERDYDSYFQNIINNQNNVKQLPYDKYVKMLIDKQRKAKARCKL